MHCDPYQKTWILKIEMMNYYDSWKAKILKGYPKERSVLCVDSFRSDLILYNVSIEGLKVK
jgi:hypothetical protein